VHTNRKSVSNIFPGEKANLQPLENTDKSSGISVTGATGVSPEDRLRAQIYRLLAGFLSCSPDKASLEAAANLAGDESDFGIAASNFAKIAKQTTPEAADVEYHDLFIGVTRGELLPYGSYYQTGFLNEKPLAILRSDMAAKSIERVSDLKEPEDHIASVLEMMAGLIEGAYGTPLSLVEQKKFFDKHVNSWASHFFKDLEAAKSSVLYAPFGTMGRLFMKIEQDGFEMVR